MPKKKDHTGQWLERSNRDKSAAPKKKGSSGSLKRTTLFPHGTKPFNYREKIDGDDTELLALGLIISQQDEKEGNSEGDKSHLGSDKDNQSQDDFLNELDDFNGEMTFNAGARSFTDQDDNGSQNEDHFSVDYSVEENPDEATTEDNFTNQDKVSTEDNTTNQDNTSTGDNAIIDGLGENAEATEEIIVSIKKPVLTQQIIMDLIENQTTSARNPSITSWDRKKEEFGQMLDGYESPTSRTVQVDVGLATLMIISAVAENTNRINIAAQQEQRDIMMKQAELHRDNLEKEFTSGLERIKAEHDRVISEAKKFREEYERSCFLHDHDKNISTIGDKQGLAVMTFQMGILQRKADRALNELKQDKDNHERELQLAKDNYERELHREKSLIRAQAIIIEEERKKVIQLKEELSMYEESVLLGMMPNEPRINTSSRNESPDPIAPKHKKIKMDDDKSEDKLVPEGSSSEDKIGIKKEAPPDDGKELKLLPIYFDENDKMHYEETTAYTTSTRDKSNILIVKKDAKATRSADDTIRGATEPKVLGAHLITHQPRLPTQDEINTVLNAWRALLRSSNDYYPDKKKTPEEHLVDLKILMGARGSFNRNVDMTPLERQQWRHQEYGPLHRQYFIPLDYMAPDTFFDKFKNTDDYQIVYWKRICSMRDYYEMLSRDNPQYKPRVPRITSTNPNPRDYRPAQKKNIAHNPYISGDKAPSDKWGKGLMSSTQNTSHHNAWKDQNNGLMGVTSPRTQAITSAPKIRSAPLSDKIRFEEQKISQLSVEQQHASERTHRHRSDTSRSTVPVPNSDNESSQDDSDSLFDDKLLPPEKSKIMRLRKEIKRIKGGQTYPTGYERDREREIKSADALRLAGKPIPTYLEGVKPPWIGMGKAHIQYDYKEISKREEQIEKIKRLNAEHCQLEHIANMPSIERKGGPGGQVQG